MGYKQYKLLQRGTSEAYDERSSTIHTCTQRRTTISGEIVWQITFPKDLTMNSKYVEHQQQ